MNTPAGTIAQSAARILMRMANAQSQWIDAVDTPEEPALRAEVIVQKRAYLDLFADMPAGEGARIKGHLYRLDRAATAGDVDVASREYETVEASGIFN